MLELQEVVEEDNLWWKRMRKTDGQNQSTSGGKCECQSIRTTIRKRTSQREARQRWKKRPGRKRSTERTSIERRGQGVRRASGQR